MRADPEPEIGEEPNEEVREHDPEDRATRAPSAPNSSVVRRYSRRMSRRRAPIAFIAAISPVCSPISVDIVLDTSTSAVSSASSVMIVNMPPSFSNSDLPG